ncbi:HNH endonuclease [Streptomyces sp. DSM 110735]|uniref:HNH endonuclease n=1 Tax=Streptomyces sp. DSM 110735 TaxID=2775031 RepID=UPI0018F6A151|nr:HNH endonuclease [Streptomyces sp. DSM 110735]MBJ7903992.1 HNH endonuclease [Streptomyces sp. DSM 110735]
MNDSSQKPNSGQRSARLEGAQQAALPAGSESDEMVKGIALYHDMRVEEDFTKCATRLFSILKQAAAANPGAPRYLYLDIQGHRNTAGGFDADAFEIIQEFLLGFLGPYLTEISTPLYRVRNPGSQREDVPDVLNIRDPDREHAYDHRELGVRNRERNPDQRRSRPPVQAIADYLGLDEPICLICWQAPVERAHVVPESLGGSNDVRNFALLCPRHHREAPDVADAEAFWSWVDYACERDGHMKWEGVDREMLAKAERAGLRIDTSGPVRKSLHHFGRVREELVRHYGWRPEDFAGGDHWGALMEEFHTVMESATSTHFNVAKKASTEAWAFEVARRRLRDGRKESGASEDLPSASNHPSVDLAERTVRKSPESGSAQSLVDAARRADIATEAAALVHDIIVSAGVSTAEDVLRGIKEEVADRTAQFERLADELMGHAVCRYCGHAIARIGDASWRHSAAAPMSRGCRAASFDRDGTWDDSLDRAWKATPPKTYR